MITHAAFIDIYLIISNAVTPTFLKAGSQLATCVTNHPKTQLLEPQIFPWLWVYGSAGWLFWSQLSSLMCWVSSVGKVNSSGDLGWSVSHVWGLVGYCWYAMALVGMSGCSLIFPEANLVCSHGIKVPRMQSGSTNASCCLGSKLTYCHFATLYGLKQVRLLRLGVGKKNPQVFKGGANTAT